MKKIFWVWVGILLLAAGLRFWVIGKYPAEMDMDEAANGYYAYSLLSGGRDEYGNLWPVYFPSNGDYKPAGYAFASTLWVKLGGLSEISTRLASAVAGVLAVALIGVLGWKLSGKPKVGRYSAAVMAVMPWHIWMSRGAYEVNLGLTMLLLTITVLVCMKNRRGYILAAVVFGIWAELTYPTARWMVMALAAGTAGWGVMKKKYFLTAAMAGLLIAGGWGMLAKGAGARTGQTISWVARAPELKTQTLDRIREDGQAEWRQPLWVTRAFHNKAVAAVADIGERYITYFNPGYLFVSGDPRPRFNFIQVGPLLLVFLPLILAGLVSRQGANKIWWAAVGWWLVGTIPAAVSNENYHLLRHEAALPGIVMLIGYGWWVITEKIGNSRVRQVVTGLAAVAIVVNLAVVADYYIVHKNYFRPWYSDGGTKEMVQTASGMLGDYEGAAISRDQYVYWAFYNRIDPEEFRRDLRLEEGAGEYDWERVAGWRNLRFKMPSDCPKLGKRNILYICRGTEVPQNAQVLKIFRFNDGVPAYTLIRFLGLGEKFDTSLPERVTRMTEVDLRFGKEGLLPADYPKYWL